MRRAGLKWWLLTWLCVLLLRSSAWGQDVRQEQTRVLVPEGEDPAILLAPHWDAMGEVYAVTFSPDGELLATASSDKTVRLWTVKTGMLVRSLKGHSNGVLSVAFSPDGQLLATASDDKMARLWDAKTGKLLRSLEGYNNWALSVAFSPDGQLLATAYSDNTVRLWDPQTGKLLHSLEGHSDRVLSVAFSPDGQLLATASSDNTARLWDTKTSKLLRSLEGHSNLVRSVVFSPDGQLLATASDDKTARLWDTKTGQLLRSLEGHSNLVLSAAFSPDGQLVATASSDRTIRLWGAKTGRLLRSLEGHSNWVRSVAFSPDGRLIATASDDKTARLWDAKTGKLLRSLEDHCSEFLSAAFSPDGQLIATASDSKTARLWDAKTGKLLSLLEGHSNLVSSVAFSPDGRLVATASYDKTARLWDAKTGKLLRLLEGHRNKVRSVVFSPDSESVATASADGKVRLWDTKAGKLLHSLEGHNDEVRSVTFSPDGQLIASASDDRTVRLWDAKTGKLTRQLEGLGNKDLSVAFSPDGQLLATVSDSNYVRIWDAKTGKMLRSLEGYGNWSLSVAFSPDGQLLATASKYSRVRIWDAKTGKMLRSLMDYGHRDRFVAFNPDGQLLATASDDGLVRMWDKASGGLRGILELGGNGWAAVMPGGGKLYRHDDGRVLYQRHAGGRVAPELPPRPAVSAALKLTLLPAETKPVGEALATGRVTVRIENAVGAGRAYWLRLSSPDLPKDVSLIPPEPYLRLEPGEAVQLPIEVSAVTLADEPVGPHPGRVRFTVQLEHAFGAGPAVQVELPRQAPLVTLTAARLSGDRGSAQVGLTLRNVGDQDADSITVEGCVLPASAAADAPCAEPGPVQTFPAGALAPGKTVSLSLPVPQALRRSFGFYLHPLRVRLIVQGSIWPTHVWQQVSSPLRPISLAWAAAPLLLALLLAGIVLRPYLDPIVRQVAREPASLLRLSLVQLPMADRSLQRVGRRDSALAAAGLSTERWARALTTARQPGQAARVLCEALGARLGATLSTSQPAFAVELPPLRLRFAKHSAIVVLTGHTLEAGAAARLAVDLYDGGQGPSVALALDLTAAQQARQALGQVPQVAFVVISAEALRDLLLGIHEHEALENIIASQRPIVELSPYQIGGGVEDPRMFFGRAMELRRMADEKLHNILLVGPRQMGKSSLLNALERRLPQRRDVLAVHRITLSGEHLATAAARARGTPLSTEGTDDDKLFTLLAGEREQPRVWLIDEADALINASGWRGTTRVLRALSEENRAHFVLAGFWGLYAAVTLDPHNPLRNFGQSLRLGPLDRDAARALVAEPLAALGLTFDSAALLDRLLNETGCRANLLALCCDGLIRSLDATARTLDAALIERILSSYEPLHDELKYWRTSPVPAQAPLDRAVLRAALLLHQQGGPVAAASIRALLQARAPRIHAEDYRQSLDRLELGYLLIPAAPQATSAGRRDLICPVPLIAAAVAKEDLAAGIADDLADLAAAIG